MCYISAASLLPRQKLREPGSTYGNTNPPLAKNSSPHALSTPANLAPGYTGLSQGPPTHQCTQRASTNTINKNPKHCINGLAPGAAALQGQRLPCPSNKDTHARNVQKPRHQKRQLQGCNTPSDTHENTKLSLRQGCSICWT